MTVIIGNLPMIRPLTWTVISGRGNFFHASVLSLSLSLDVGVIVSVVIASVRIMGSFLGYKELELIAGFTNLTVHRARNLFFQFFFKSFKSKPLRKIFSSLRFFSTAPLMHAECFL